MPLVGDFHFNGHKLLAAASRPAPQALAKYRINPGNVGRGSKRDPQFAAMIETACRYGKPVRIGVNWGSLDQDLLTRMMDENSRLPEPLDALEVMREATVVSALASRARAPRSSACRTTRIVISCKVSGVQDLIAIYRELAARCDYPLHLGLTEAGMGAKGIVVLDRRAGGAAAGGHRRHHPRVADAGARRRPPRRRCASRRRSCRPWACAPSRRWSSPAPAAAARPAAIFQELAQRIQEHVRERMPDWRARLSSASRT